MEASGVPGKAVLAATELTGKGNNGGKAAALRGERKGRQWRGSGVRRVQGRAGGRPEVARAADGRESAAAAVEQSSSHAGGRRRLGGTSL